MIRLWAWLASLATPALRFALLRRAGRGKEIKTRLPERRGRTNLPRPPGKLLWLHAASVGETISLLPLLRALPADIAVVFTTGTVTSATLIAERLPALGLAHRVIHQFVPLDVPAWVRRFLDHWRPNAVAFVESEIWPNMIAECARRGLPLLLLNGRMSERSLRGWQRAPALARHLIGAFDRIWAQSNADAARFQALGGRNVSSPGNLKFCADPLPADPTTLAQLQPLLAARPVWLAASTHKGEEELIARVHRRLAPEFPGLLTIIVPRHPGRGAQIAAELGASRRSLAEPPPAEGIWIADTLGELGLFYRAVRSVFVGKSLGAQGGQNPLEPARLGCAIAVGPHTANFTEAVTLLRTAGGLNIVPDEAALADWVTAMLRDPTRAETMGKAAQGVLESSQELPRALARAVAEYVR
jgi:3-deoxy-D-manno-octulosonic-acid transferase